MGKKEAEFLPVIGPKKEEGVGRSWHRPHPLKKEKKKY
jgi:hypothetical protein